MKLSQYENKLDFLYEMRPMACLLIGLIGVFNHSLASAPTLHNVARVSGLLAIGLAIRIWTWRYNHRKFQGE